MYLQSANSGLLFVVNGSSDVALSLFNPQFVCESYDGTGRCDSTVVDGEFVFDVNGVVTVNYYNLYLDPFILYFPLFDISYVIISLLLLLFFDLDYPLYSFSSLCFPYSYIYRCYLRINQRAKNTVSVRKN
jgi:hypothetical protein